jgi:glucose/arabinose dehydrogenase
VLLLALAGAPAAHAQIEFENPAFESRTVTEGLEGPTAIAWTPDGRMLIIEKAGRLRVYDPSTQQTTLVLDISDIVGDNGDRGLLGVAVDSAYATNNFIYLLYTRDTGLMDDDSGAMVSQLARYTLSPSNVVASPTVILGTNVPASGGCAAPSNTNDCIPSDGDSHSIGSVRAAPDGTLWVGSGDAAGYGGVDLDALRAYDERTYAGKIMHIDRNGNGLSGHPFCPSTTNLTRVCTKLHAKGFRNPFRFQLRPGGAGLAIGDVGWTEREELDLVPLSPGGTSYGWPCYEGSIRTGGYEDLPECEAEYAKPEGTHLPPAYDYPHEDSNAILAGPVVTGTNYPPGYRNKLYIADYASGELQRVTIDAQDKVTSIKPFASRWGDVDIELGPNGNLFYVTIYGGRVEEIVYTPENLSPTAVAGANPTSGPAPLDVQFDGDDSSDPDGDTLTYDWDFGDGTTSSQPNPQHTYSNPGSYTATLTVNDGRGGSDTDTVLISPGNTPPNTPSIVTPADESLYRDGATIDLQGTATDPQEGTLPGTALSWSVLLHHGSHTHPVADIEGTGQTTFQTFTNHDADSYYEITLTATDSGGLTSSRVIQIRPETVNFRLESSPSGAAVTYAGVDFTTPFSTQSAIGFETSVSATEQFVQGGRTWEFQSWSDGGARVHNVTIPATATTLTATYEDVTPGSVTIVKQTEPDGAPDEFGFSGDAPFGSFSLGDGQSRTVAVDPGTYSVTEAAEAGWDLSGVVCTGGGSASGATATIVMAAGQSVRCVFTNTKRGRITIRAATDPPEDPPIALFPFTGDPPLASFVLAHDGTRSVEAPPGAYSVRQDTPPGYKLTAVGCDDADSASSATGAEASVKLAAAEAVTCTFTARRDEGAVLGQKKSSAPTLATARLSKKRRVLAGRVEDPDGIETVDVAVGRRRQGRCRWWSKKDVRLASKPKRCRRPRWIHAQVVGKRWLVKLGGSLPPGHFRIVIRVVDELGDVSLIRTRL